MASGWGVNGGKGRCFDFWMDFRECVSRCEVPSECALLREDYFECLHHRKEYMRRNAITREQKRQAAEEKKQGHKTDGEDHH